MRGYEDLLDTSAQADHWDALCSNLTADRIRTTLRSGTSQDAEQFVVTLSSMAQLGMALEQQLVVFRMVAAIAHLSNVRFGKPQRAVEGASRSQGTRCGWINVI